MLEKASFACAGGLHPGQFAPGVLVPGGDRSGPTEAAAETAAYTALAGEASARPRRGGAPWAIRALGPGPRWGPFRTDRGGSRDGGLTPRLRERLAHVRAGGLHPGQFAPVVLVPGGDRSGPTEAAAETAA